MFLDALREMVISESSIVRRSIVLIDFSGEHKSTLGEIVLLVYAKGVNLPTKFLVMDCPSVYNAILGRPWIHEMEVMLSTYHHVMQFPTKWGVKEIRGQQKDSRDCYQNTLRRKPLSCSNYSRAPLQTSTPTNQECRNLMRCRSIPTILTIRHRLE